VLWGRALAVPVGMFTSDVVTSATGGVASSVVCGPGAVETVVGDEGVMVVGAAFCRRYYDV